jgi:DNA-binding protein HU-beta
MAKSMTKSQIADYLAGKAGITKKGAVQILDDLAALAYREAKNVFTVPGIGKLKLANRKARIGRKSSDRCGNQDPGKASGQVPCR